MNAAYASLVEAINAQVGPIAFGVTADVRCCPSAGRSRSIAESSQVPRSIPRLPSKFGYRVLMGDDHATISLTLHTYSRLLEGMQREAASRLDDLLG